MNATKVFSNNLYSKAPYELNLVPYFHWYPEAVSCFDLTPVLPDDHLDSGQILKMLIF